jgi:hypothetical protein
MQTSPARLSEAPPNYAHFSVLLLCGLYTLVNVLTFLGICLTLQATRTTKPHVRIKVVFPVTHASKLCRRFLCPRNMLIW